MRIYLYITRLSRWFAKGLGLQNIMLFRCIVGGVWYKQSMSGELPGCYGSWWTQHPHPPHRYHYTEKTEDWTTDIAYKPKNKI